MAASAAPAFRYCAQRMGAPILRCAILGDTPQTSPRIVLGSSSKRHYAVIQIQSAPWAVVFVGVLESPQQQSCGVLISGAEALRHRGQQLVQADKILVETLEYKTRTLEREAEQVSGWLHEMRGLVEPEPR